MYQSKFIENLNNTISKHFPHLKTIEPGYHIALDGVSRMVMLDRYAQKDSELISLTIGDLVLVVVREDPTFPTRAIGFIEKQLTDDEYLIRIDNEYLNVIDEQLLWNKNYQNLIKKTKSEITKPLEVFYEQIAYRVAKRLAKEEKPKLRAHWREQFYQQLSAMNVIPAGRVLYGAGSESKVTFFNCFVMPLIEDSRQGISHHRSEVMEIMSRGGGVGTNGSTLRPRHALAKTVGGKSSGAVSWLNDISTLTHLVEQGGSRRGAQMIMLADWHPDIVEFIISKMQNPRILMWLKENSKDELIRTEAERKLKFTPLSADEQKMYEQIIAHHDDFDFDIVQKARAKLNAGGEWNVHRPDFLTGANISVNISDGFMKAVLNDDDWALRFPDIDNYSEEERKAYDLEWQKIGDVRLWAKKGYKIKTYYKIRARELWNLIIFCATYSAEPGIFFIDQANRMTNARSYGQRVVATNPCGEQPLAPYSVCNLSAINLANFVDHKTQKVLWANLKKAVATCTRMQDNVINATYYFLKANESQALGERRVGLGVMGLHDLLIWAGYRYGSKDANKFVDELFKVIATTAYETSIELAKEKGSFPFLDSNEAFINTGFMKTMPESIRAGVLKYGIRNSHLLTIAPTGSTGTMVGVSTGLEPYFAFSFYRSGRLGKSMKVDAKIVQEWLALHPQFKAKPLPDIFVTAMELSPIEHATVQCVIQRWVDSSISKTVNAPRGFSVADVEKIYMFLYKGGAKGGTVYVDGSRDNQVLSLSKEDVSFVTEQIDLSNLGVDVKTKTEKKHDPHTYKNYRGVRQDREIGTDIGDLCPICKEGTVIDAGGCATCNNCNAQLKCGL